jgi:hypothetical protein
MPSGRKLSFFPGSRKRVGGLKKQLALSQNPRRVLYVDEGDEAGVRNEAEVPKEAGAEVVLALVEVGGNPRQSKRKRVQHEASAV